MRLIAKYGQVEIWEVSETYGFDFYVYGGARLVRVCPSIGMARDYAGSWSLHKFNSPAGWIDDRSPDPAGCQACCVVCSVGNEGGWCSAVLLRAVAGDVEEIQPAAQE